MTSHAKEEMDNDTLSIYDVERGVLTVRIIERQKDQETNEWKYILLGKTIPGSSFFLVAKLSVTGKMIIITIYKAE